MLTTGQKCTIKNLLNSGIETDKFLDILDNIVDEVCFDIQFGKLFVRRNNQHVGTEIEFGIKIGDREIHFGNILCYEHHFEVYTWELENTEYDLKEATLYEEDLIDYIKGSDK